MNKVKLSVVTVCFNAVDLIERTILSVINQTYDNLEYRWWKYRWHIRYNRKVS